MIQINSFCGESSFLRGNDAPDDAVEKATTKAEKWIEELEEEWKQVEVTTLTAQYKQAGDYAMYFITMTVKVEESF